MQVTETDTEKETKADSEMVEKETKTAVHLKKKNLSSLHTCSGLQNKKKL